MDAKAEAEKRRDLGVDGHLLRRGGALLFYAIRIYGAGDMTSHRASHLILASAFLTAASFTLLLAYSFKEIAS